MSRVKGSAVLSRLDYVRTHHGPEGASAFVAALRPKSRELIEQGVLAGSWVPFDLFIDLNVTADRLFGAGDLRLCVTMARFGAEKNLPTLYRMFFRIGSPAFIMRRAASLWHQHYDAGRLTVQQDDETSARLRMEGFDTPHTAHCLSVLGWAARSVELTGAKLMAAQHTICRVRGEPLCETLIRWA